MIYVGAHKSWLLKGGGEGWWEVYEFEFAWSTCDYLQFEI